MVVDRSGLPATARVVIRDRNREVVRECYTGSPRAGSFGGRFEARGLATGTYVIEITSPGFAPEVRYGIRVEAPCATDIGNVRLMRADSPSITVHPHRPFTPFAQTPATPRPPGLR
jgi:hypothetical protein